jgi:hypothetical protein
MNPDGERLWTRVDVRFDHAACWEWQGYRDRRGYGQIGVSRPRRRLVYAHRLAWEDTNGPIPDGMMVCHSCDNPPCCNPAHLFLGTQRDNMQDASDKGRVKPHNVKLTEDQVRAIRALYGTMPQYRIAERFGISKMSVSFIVRRMTWKHVE